jgi:hypothetical protein
MLALSLCVGLLALPGSAADPDRKDRDSLRGIPKGHKHLWAIIGGAAVGGGLGAIGGTSGFFKGALIGGSGASALYLVKHRNQEGPWSYVITNAGLVAGIGWAVCDCGAGGGAGALIGGGGTALFQAFKPRNKTLAKVTGANAPGVQENPPPPPPSPSAPAPQPQQAPQQAPQLPQGQPPQPPEPQAQPQQPPPQAQPPNQSNPPQENLPDSPQPKDRMLK